MKRVPASGRTLIMIQRFVSDSSTVEMLTVRELRKLFTEDEIAEAAEKCDACGLIVVAKFYAGGAGRHLCYACYKKENPRSK